MSGGKTHVRPHMSIGAQQVDLKLFIIHGEYAREASLGPRWIGHPLGGTRYTCGDSYIRPYAPPCTGAP